jgi:predicted RecB family nuclease
VPAGISAETFAKVREQAELQLWAREHGSDVFRVLQPQPEAGLALLPDSSPGDLFFDFEGNPFWDASGGLEYLWGFSTPSGASRRCTRIGVDQFADLSKKQVTASVVHHVVAIEPNGIGLCPQPVLGSDLAGRAGERDELRRENQELRDLLDPPPA